MGASGHFRSRAAIRAAAAAAAVEELAWQGRGGGKEKEARSDKPEPPRGGSRDSRRGKRFRGRRRAGREAHRASRAFSWPARAPDMHLHQVLTGAVNPGDNCYSVGSVGDVPFTVSGVGEPKGERPGSGGGARDPLSRAHASLGGCEVLLGPTRSPSAAQLRGGGVLVVAAAWDCESCGVGNNPLGERLRNPPHCPPSLSKRALGVTRLEGSSPRAAQGLR